MRYLSRRNKRELVVRVVFVQPHTQNHLSTQTHGQTQLSHENTQPHILELYIKEGTRNRPRLVPADEEGILLPSSIVELLG